MRTLIQVLNEKENMLVGGHRGHQSEIRENTIENFNEVCHLNLSHLEIDVQLTKDQIAVVYHDIDLHHKTRLTGMIRDYTYEQLKETFSIYTLDEIVKYCVENSILLAIEIKTRHIDMCDDVILLMEKISDIVRERKFEEYCFVFSVDYRALNYLKSLNQNVNIGLIVPHIPIDPIRLMQENNAIIYLTYIENLSKDIVMSLHREGYFVDGSVINTKERLKRAMDLNVDMIESDFPDLILKEIE